MANQPIARGNITPTFGHGGSGGGGYPGGLGAPPLSPNRGLQLQGGGNPNSLSQRSFLRHDRRMFGGIGSMAGGMGVLNMGGQRSVYPPSSDHHLQILDPQEFPLLTSRSSSGDSYHQSLPAKPYVGFVKPPQPESSAFTMSSEDFPALPGTNPPPVNTTNDASGKATPSSGSQTNETVSDGRTTTLSRDNTKRGIITSPDGKVSNIPGSMVNDQFGMVGLLTFIRVADTDPNLVSLALGFDLTALGLNLNATDSLYPTFSGPWGEGPVRAEDIECSVPQEYNMSNTRHAPEYAIRDKLGPLKLNRYKEELLFYLFYTYTGDVLQLLAASELYSRDWRYHKEEKIWITRAPGNTTENRATYERGTYFFWDPMSWRKVAKEFFLEYEKLEDRPSVPITLAHAYLSP